MHDTDNLITPELLARAKTYRTYRIVIDGLLAGNKTTGDDHSEAMINYTRMNVTRMNRLDKTVNLTDHTIETLERLNDSNLKLIWLVLTEAWCGDAAQIVPVMNKIDEESDHISLRLILRDEHPELMDQHLTNGGRAIPKLLIVDANNYEILATWGPRPKEAQDVMELGKEQMNSKADERERNLIFEMIKTRIHSFYASDKTESIQRELMELIRSLFTNTREVY